MEEYLISSQAESDLGYSHVLSLALKVGRSPISVAAWRLM